MITKAVQKVFNQLGYSINLTKYSNDLSIYNKLYGKKAIQNRQFYNIGAGDFSHPAWTNLDYYSIWYKSRADKIHINYDLFSISPLPIQDESAFIVYTSHTIEHINDKAAQNMFNETYRILKSNAYFRVTAPNVDLAFNAFFEKDFYFYDWQKYITSEEKKIIKKPINEATISELFLWQIASNVSPLHADGAEKRFNDKDLEKIFNEMQYEEALSHIVSYCSLDIQKKYPGNHINWWNPNKVTKMLKKSGFKEIYLSAYGQSKCPVLRNIFYFDNTHPNMSFYVEAKK